MELPKVVILFGPTGVGKTATIEKYFSHGAEVVSADSLQIYKDLNIGTAKPPRELRNRIPHHLIDIIKFTESFSVVEFCHQANTIVENILSRGRLPVISGGTAYYIKAWVFGPPQTPQADPLIRETVERRWRDKSDSEIRRELLRVDSLSAERIGLRDRYRMLRALEIITQTGRPASDFPVRTKPRQDYRILSIGLRRDRQALNRRIAERVDAMLADGLADEAAALRLQGATAQDPGMKAIGYREWFGAHGKDSPGSREVRELIIQNTRRYAKRQMTFFRSLPDVRWFDAADETDESGCTLSETVASFVSGHGSLDQPAKGEHNP